MATHIAAAGGAVVYFSYRPLIKAYNAVDSGVKMAVDKFHKVKAAL